MKTLKSFALVASLATIAPAAMAGQDRIAYARVIESRPVYEQVERRIPQEHCWVETVARQHQRSDRRATPVVLGGIVGGALGHAVGHGHDNKKVGAAVGAVLGAAVGADLERQRRGSSRVVRYEDVERCEIRETITTFEQLVGYDVTYQYSGQRYTTRMRNKPGDRLKVAVDVRPLAY